MKLVEPDDERGQTVFQCRYAIHRRTIATRISRRGDGEYDYNNPFRIRNLRFLLNVCAGRHRISATESRSQKLDAYFIVATATP